MLCFLRGEPWCLLISGTRPRSFFLLTRTSGEAKEGYELLNECYVREIALRGNDAKTVRVDLIEWWIDEKVESEGRSQQMQDK